YLHLPRSSSERHRRRTRTPARAARRTNRQTRTEPSAPRPGTETSRPPSAVLPTGYVRVRQAPSGFEDGSLSSSAARFGPELPGQAVEQLAVDAAQASRGEGALEEPAAPAAALPDGGKVQVGGGGAGRGGRWRGRWPWGSGSRW